MKPNFGNPFARRWLVPINVALILAAVCNLVNAQYLESASYSTIYPFTFHPAVETDTELAAPTLVKTGKIGELNSEACAKLCSLNTNCTGYSFGQFPGNNTAVCKLGPSPNTTRNATGSQVVYEVAVDGGGWITHLYPFQYKIFNLPASSARDAGDFCILRGSLLPVGFPYAEAYDSLRSLMMLMHPNSTFFVGVELTNPSTSNGSILFTTYRDWPVYVHPSNRDPKQPWATNQPQLLAFSKTSDINVMMGRDGWFVVNVADGSIRTNSVVCMRHATYEIWSGSYRFYSFVASPKQTWFNASLLCEREGAVLARAYGQTGLDLIRYSEVVKKVIDPWLAGIEMNANGKWAFPDGVVLDDEQRNSDPRQIWHSYPSKPTSSLTLKYCARDLDYKLYTATCTSTNARICEGLF